MQSMPHLNSAAHLFIIALEEESSANIRNISLLISLGVKLSFANTLTICAYIYRVECSPLVQSLVESYQRLRKMVLDTSLLNTQHYKVHIKGKVEPAMERSSTLLYT